LRKILSFIIALIILLSFTISSLTVYAAEECTVIVETVDAATGDDVFVNLNIKNNPGIMAMTISITYNSSALEYIDYYYGDVFTDYTVAAHPTRNLIRLVISEKKNKDADGIVASFKFKVAKDAEFKLHDMTVEYSSGDFCDYDLKRIMPKIVSGGVNVAFNGSNCSHKEYGEWKQTVAPSCEKEGVSERICKKCNHADHKDIEPVGHTYSDKWTVDIPATADKPGTMSRHCLRCDTSIDETNFTLQNSTDAEFENKYDATVPENDAVKDIITKQHPDIDFEEIKNSQNSKPQSSSSEKNDDTNEIKSSDEAKEDKLENFLNTITPEDSKNSSVSLIAKLRETIPQIDTLFNVFKNAIIIIIILVLI
jgi:hypothetical protein